jgi:hypothetical protein
MLVIVQQMLLVQIFGFASWYATDARDSNFMGFNAGLAATYASFKFLLVRVLVNQHMHLIQISLVSKLVVHYCF